MAKTNLNSFNNTDRLTSNHTIIFLEPVDVDPAFWSQTYRKPR